MFLTSAVITVLIYSGSYDFCDVSDDTGDEGRGFPVITNSAVHLSFRTCLILFPFMFLFNVFCFRDQLVNTVARLAAEEPDSFHRARARMS